ncbi:MAG: carbon storage regulator [Rickettsiaceae bacterium]|nr:carbon storage regulator [Rickettsiaceae bacterium]
MLYITRKEGEFVIINNDIKIHVIEIKGGRVKIGCDFPTDTTILRGELHQKISDVNKSSLDGFHTFESKTTSESQGE